MGAEHGDIAIRREQESAPPESLRTLAAAGKISDKFAEATLEAYFPSPRHTTASPQSPQNEHQTNALIPYGQLDTKGSGFRRIIQRVKGALGKKSQETPLGRLAREIDELRSAVPLPITFEVDDETSSTKMRGRVATKIALPKEELDEMLKRDGLTLQIDAVSHRVRITTTDGRVMDARMPYLLEGSRFYVDEDGQRYLFERLSLLNPDQQTRYGIMSKKDRENATNQLKRIAPPLETALEVEPMRSLRSNQGE